MLECLLRFTFLIHTTMTPADIETEAPFAGAHWVEASDFLGSKGHHLHLPWPLVHVEPRPHFNAQQVHPRRGSKTTTVSRSPHQSFPAPATTHALRSLNNHVTIHFPERAFFHRISQTQTLVHGNNFPDKRRILSPTTGSILKLAKTVTHHRALPSRHPFPSHHPLTPTRNGRRQREVDGRQGRAQGGGRQDAEVTQCKGGPTGKSRS